MRYGSRRAAWRFIMKRLLCLSVFLIMIIAYYGAPAYAAEKWQGVDESVVEKFAREHGRQAHEPLINTDQGDLLLFVFLLAGSVGGFAAGYYWRILMVEKGKKPGKEAR
jgi:ABC-type cobalt transport system substrate-binding protein